MTRRILAPLAAAGLLGLAACAPGQLGTGLSPQAEGAAVGAGAGALAGQALGGDTRSTVAGAVIGGTAGGIIGHDQARRDHAARQQQAGVAN